MGLLKRVNNACTYRGKKLQKSPPAPKARHNRSHESQHRSGLFGRIISEAKQKLRKAPSSTGSQHHLDGTLSCTSIQPTGSQVDPTLYPVPSEPSVDDFVDGKSLGIARRKMSLLSETSNASRNTSVKEDDGGMVSESVGEDGCQKRLDSFLSEGSEDHEKTPSDGRLPVHSPLTHGSAGDDATQAGGMQNQIDTPTSQTLADGVESKAQTVGLASQHDSCLDCKGQSEHKLRHVWDKVKGMAQHTVSLMACFKSQEREQLEDPIVCIKKKGDSDDEEDDDDDRCQWDILHSIPKETYKNLIRSLPFGATFRDVFIPSVTNGSYHFVVFVKALNDRYYLEDYVIKIPGQGTWDRWTTEDSYMLEREVDTMRLVRSCTSIPVPEIMAWSSNMNNSFGFPYIIMRRLPGNDATKIWYDQPHNQTDPDHITDFVSPETEKKRLTFLRSLAHNMTQLNQISFEGIGLPYQAMDGQLDFPLPVAKAYLWNSRTDIHAMEVREPTKTTPDYIRRARADFLPPKADTNGKYSRSEQAIAGIYKLLDIAFSHPVFQSKPNDTFVLQHSDLDLQNILTDEEGNVTGIIDWDGSIAAPRCVGHAAVPNFLCHNWFPDHGDDRLVLRADHYRNVYAAAMVEAGNPDAKYTSKSAMYQALIAAIYEGGSMYDITDKLLSEIPGCRTPGRQIATFLGSSTNSKLEEALKTELHKVLEPELPHVDINEVFAEVAAQL